MKYNNRILKEMAIFALQAKENGDERYMFLIMKLSLATGISVEQCEQRISEFAAFEEF